MDAQNIKESLAGRAEEFVTWLFPSGQKSGHEWQVGSLNGERGKSLSICIAGSKVGVFADFATGDKGDNLVELLSQARRISFVEALRECRNWLGGSAVTSQPRAVIATKRLPDVYEPTLEECNLVVQMAQNLSLNPELCDKIAKSRKWRAEIIRDLALDHYLGWHDGKLAFIYDGGVKLRWRENGERVIRWAFGKPWLWRGGRMGFVDTVYVCEGESDAISLIHSGVETDGLAVVVALPSASTFNADWVSLFRGKDVILWLDNDPAGLRATEKVSKLLSPVARSLKAVNWKGVLQYAS